MARRRRNPSTAATLGWSAGAALVTAGVTYLVLKEVFTKQAIDACMGSVLGGFGQTSARMDTRALERRVRQML